MTVHFYFHEIIMRVLIWNLDPVLIFCGVFLLCLCNISIIINFKVLKYIKKIFKIPTQYNCNAQQRTIQNKINRKSRLVNLIMTYTFL